jgi:hypothetical protein
MTEAPDVVLDALRDFVSATASLRSST